MCFAVDIIGLIFGVNNFLAAVQAIVSGKHVAESNGKQKVRHAVIAEQLKADELWKVSDKDGNGETTYYPYSPLNQYMFDKISIT